jgi:hypothetical protein
VQQPLTLTITRKQLANALLQWEQQHRAGETRTPAETAALPAEQVAVESGKHLWKLLAAPPVDALDSGIAMSADLRAWLRGRPAVGVAS